LRVSFEAPFRLEPGKQRGGMFQNDTRPGLSRAFSYFRRCAHRAVAWRRHF
jgi:hypothetical protein